MENKELVSIIIPIYNGEKWLANAVNSALLQTYTNIEVLLVDDGSTDNSFELCRSFQSDKRVRLIHKINGGQASARNIGLHEAKGKYIQFLDCDDTLAKNAIAVALDYMYDDVDLVLYGLNIFNKGNLLRTPHTERMSYRGEYEKFKKWSYLMASPCNKLYLKTYIKSLFQEDCVYGEDGIFNYSNLSNDTHVECIEECLYNVNLDNPQSVNKRYKPGRLNDCVKSIVLELAKVSTLFGKQKMVKDFLPDCVSKLCFSIRLLEKNCSYKQFHRTISNAIYSDRNLTEMLNMLTGGGKMA